MPSNPSHHEDLILINNALDGDSMAFRQLYKKHELKVRNTLRRLCGDTDLDDLTLNVFTKAWKNLAKLENKQTFSAWLYRITTNEATEQRKEYALKREHFSPLLVEDFSNISDKQNIEQEYIHKNLVDKTLAHLGIEHRTVLVLVDLEEVSLSEAAEILEIPVGTVKSRLHTARAEARKFLEKQGVKL